MRDTKHVYGNETVSPMNWKEKKQTKIFQTRNYSLPSPEIYL